MGRLKFFVLSAVLLSFALGCTSENAATPETAKTAPKEEMKDDSIIYVTDENTELDSSGDVPIYRLKKSILIKDTLRLSISLSGLKNLDIHARESLVVPYIGGRESLDPWPVDGPVIPSEGDLFAVSMSQSEIDYAKAKCTAFSNLSDEVAFSVRIYFSDSVGAKRKFLSSVELFEKVGQ